MTKINLTSILSVLMFLLISCDQNSKTTNNSKNSINEIHSSNNNNFASFQANFKPKDIDKLNELGEEFNNHYLAKDGSLIEVSQIYKANYLQHLDIENLYYGFVTKLPNTSVILTFLKHYGAENTKDGDVIDTTFFVSLVYSATGKFQSSFRSFGSNLTGEPPTYNMRSTFKQENDKLIITNYEYSTGRNYSDAMLINGSDSIYQADLLITKYYLNYSTNKIELVNMLKSTAKVVETHRNPLPVYLRPLN